MEPVIFRQGAILASALKTIWQDVDLGMGLSGELDDLLIFMGSSAVEQVVIIGQAPSLGAIRDHVSGEVLEAAAPGTAGLSRSRHGFKVCPYRCHERTAETYSAVIGII